MATKHGLGRGLDALLQTPPAGTPPEKPAAHAPLRVPVASVRRNRMQPRRKFEESALQELADSIKTHGVLQPLLVRTAGTEYELIAGERRLRAAGMAGLTDVPVIVLGGDDEHSLELALVENLQREDLDPLEEADAYQLLITRFGLTQEDVSARVGKARASVANALRLLALSPEVRELLSQDAISVGHAKVLMALESAHEQLLYARRVVAEQLTVRELERIIKRAQRTRHRPRTVRQDIPDGHVQYLADKLHAHFGTAVRLTSSRALPNGRHSKGCLEIDFYTAEDLDRILSLLGIVLD